MSQINGHEVPLSEPGCISLFWKCSFLEHNCRPNCSKSFSDSGEVIVRASVVIKKGEHISISYTDPLWGTPSRLHHLLTTKYFTCRCQRCLDPTEFGTYFSAVVCNSRLVHYHNKEPEQILNTPLLIERQHTILLFFHFLVILY